MLCDFTSATVDELSIRLTSCERELRVAAEVELRRRTLAGDAAAQQCLFEYVDPVLRAAALPLAAEERPKLQAYVWCLLTSRGVLGRWDPIFGTTLRGFVAAIAFHESRSRFLNTPVGQDQRDPDERVGVAASELIAEALAGLPDREACRERVSRLRSSTPSTGPVPRRPAESQRPGEIAPPARTEVGSPAR